MAKWAAQGVKCVCVFAGAGTGRPDAGLFLKEGETYTVKLVQPGDAPGRYDIFVEVDKDGDLKKGTKSGPWGVKRFKPLVPTSSSDEILEQLKNLIDGQEIGDTPGDVPVPEEKKQKQLFDLFGT